MWVFWRVWGKGISRVVLEGCIYFEILGSIRSYFWKRVYLVFLRFVVFLSS